jgi:CRISPR-associated protein Cmr1
MRRQPRDKKGRAITPPPGVTHDPWHKRKSAGELVELVRQVREYELITPLYGGGVEPAHADPVTTVRVPSIRGQLRFWWRACRAGQFDGSVSVMKRKEDEIWGTAGGESQGGQSQVLVELLSSQKGKAFSARNKKGEAVPVHSPSSPYGYAAFPLREKGDAAVLEGVTFSVRLTYPEQLRDEVESALWGWETFGGVGARTRRGFGALVLRSIDGKAVPLQQCADFSKELVGELKRYVAGGQAPEGVPHLKLGTEFCVTDSAPDAIQAWRELIDALKGFRQYRRDKSTNSLSPSGKSQWPEPDAVRRLARSRETVDRERFPRADFGLPITFDLRQERLKATLKGNGEKGSDKPINRLASPLILSPTQCADGAVGIALILEAQRTPPGGLLLTGLRDDYKVSSKLSPDDAQRLTLGLKPLDNRTDVLQAFLQYLAARRSQR